MNKRLFLTASVFCLMAMPVMAECVCGTANCNKCDDTEDYLEDVGEHMKKQARKIKKTMKKQKSMKESCQANQPSYWFEEAELLDKNGNVILTYADMVEDDTFMLTNAQKKQAATDAKNLKAAGQKIKDKAMAQKQQCVEVITSYEEIDEYPVTNNRMKKKGKKHSVSKTKSGNMPQFVWIEGMAQNGDMLIEAGDFIEQNMSK